MSHDIIGLHEQAWCNPLKSNDFQIGTFGTPVTEGQTCGRAAYQPSLASPQDIGAQPSRVRIHPVIESNYLPLVDVVPVGVVLAPAAAGGLGRKLKAWTRNFRSLPSFW